MNIITDTLNEINKLTEENILNILSTEEYSSGNFYLISTSEEEKRLIDIEVKKVLDSFFSFHRINEDESRKAYFEVFKILHLPLDEVIFFESVDALIVYAKKHNLSTFFNRTLDASAICWAERYNIIQKVLNIKFDKFDTFYQYLKYFAFVIDYDEEHKILLASHNPKFMIVNENNKLHSLNGPAIEFNDGYKQFWINGECIPEEEFINRKV